jgi:hypothetical protein
MGDTWIVSLEHFLDENGAIAAPKGPARNLAEHITAIVAMASRPELLIRTKMFRHFDENFVYCRA